MRSYLHMAKYFQLYIVFIFTVLLSTGFSSPAIGKLKTFVAYSMNVAQKKVENDLKQEKKFRETSPDVYYLGGITKPLAIVFDSINNDWIIVGQRDPKSKILTLDDFIVALRARFIHGNEDPGVTIEPIGDPSEATKQNVQFFGGIEGTHFGKVCQDADWLMKKIGLGLENLHIDGLKTYYDLSVKSSKRIGYFKKTVASRFWFYPIISRVNVMDDVVLLEQFRMGVFTEVLAAKIDGKKITDLDNFDHYPSNEFAKSFSEKYDSLIKAREVLGKLQGLTRLAALSKGIANAGWRIDTDFWLLKYPVKVVDTWEDEGVKVLRKINVDVGISISGGVQLAALIMDWKGGDVIAFKKIILLSRNDLKTLVWEFQLKFKNGQPVGIKLPKGLKDFSQIWPLLTQAMFLYKQKRYDNTINLYGKIIKLMPNWELPYINRGIAYSEKGNYVKSIFDYSKDIEITPEYANAYNKNLYDLAIADYTKAIKINPKSILAYSNRGFTHYSKGEYNRAISDCNKALEKNPKYAEAYTCRGVAYYGKGDYTLAISDYTMALEIDPKLTIVYNIRGIAHHKKGQYDQAIADYNNAIEINPMDAKAYNGRGEAYMGLGNRRKACSDWKQACEFEVCNNYWLYQLSKQLGYCK